MSEQVSHAVRLGHLTNDVTLTRRIAEYLSSQDAYEFSQIKFVVESQSVVLRGVVRSHEAKLLAAKFVRQVARVQTIDNQLSVDPVEFKRHNHQAAPLSVMLREKVNLGYVATAIALFAVLWTLVPVARAWWHVEEPASPVAAYPLRLEVLCDDRPAAGAKVVLYPQKHHLDDFVPRPMGVVDAQGQARIKTFQPDDGAPAGLYRVTVAWRPMVVQGEDHVEGPNVLPGVYASPAQSPLFVEVKPGQNQAPAIRLARCQ